MRTFTLQHRLKLQRQYKVKQDHINKLLDNMALTTNQKSIQENEQAIREMLDLNTHTLPQPDLTHSASFYSLPDLSTDDYTSHMGHHQIDFKRLSQNEEPKPSTSAQTEESVRIEIDSVDTPLLKTHHRRKSSTLRNVSSASDCQQTSEF
jgi:hypothetical protein